MGKFTKVDLKKILEQENFDTSLLGDLYSFIQNDGVLFNKDVVGIREFINNPNYMNTRTARGTSIIYPSVLNELEELNSGAYVEAVLAGGIGTAKCLNINEVLPTPDGWVKMGDIKDGDIVFDEKGKQCKVVKSHSIIYNKDCYRIYFSDGTFSECCGDHLWLTRTQHDRKENRKGYLRNEIGAVKNTIELYNSLHLRHSVEIAGPIKCQYRSDLDIDPYTLGVWLGDGSSGTGIITNHKSDYEMMVYISEFNVIEERKTKPDKCNSYRIKGLTESLKKEKLLNNKHIPDTYLRASITQRLNLLQGLMDSDGTVDKRTSGCTFSNTNKCLIDDTLELIRSLGFKAKLTESDAKIYGRFISKCWKIHFTASKETPVFKLKRKLKYQGIKSERQRSTRLQKYIIDIQKIPSIPVRCITVDSPNNLYLTGEGFTPTHNTSIALYTTIYQLYLLSCYTSPHEVYHLDPNSEIVILFQNLTATKAKEVDYDRFRSMVETSPYFQNYFPFNKEIKSKLVFPNRIIVKPISGDVSGSIGENVIGGVIDEINFMDIVEKSKQTHDGSTYNQAEVLYNSLARRRESRFMYKGKMPGIICLVSSKRYPGEFTDMKIEEARHDKGIYVFDKRIWDIKPEGTFQEQTFLVFIGTESENPYILSEDADAEQYDPDYLLEVPEDYRKQFEADILDALREIGGISVRSVNPFIIDVASISNMFHTNKCILSRKSVEFKTQKMGIDVNCFKQPELPRFVHIDIGLTKDHLGIACGYVPHFKRMDRGDGLVEELPFVELDFAIDVIPPKNDEIDLSKIRALVFKLYELGLNITWITMDSYNSADMLQRFRQKGFKAGVQSVDKTTTPYLVTKGALSDRRVSAPYHPRLEKELLNLEHDAVQDKIDHPSHGSKDIADCLAGVVYGISRQRVIWIDHGISTVQMRDYAQRFKEEKKEEEEEPYMQALKRMRRGVSDS